MSNNVKYRYVSGSAMREIEVITIRLSQFKEFANLDRADDLHLPLTSAQYSDLEEAINHLNRLLKPV